MGRGASKGKSARGNLKLLADKGGPVGPPCYSFFRIIGQIY